MNSVGVPLVLQTAAGMLAASMATEARRKKEKGEERKKIATLEANSRPAEKRTTTRGITESP